MAEDVNYTKCEAENGENLEGNPLKNGEQIVSNGVHEGGDGGNGDERNQDGVQSDKDNNNGKGNQNGARSVEANGECQEDGGQTEDGNQNGVETKDDDDDEGNGNSDSEYSADIQELMRHYFSKWRKRTFHELLHRDKLLRAAILVSFCQQVHIYDQEIYFHLHRGKEGINVSEIIATRRHHLPSSASVLSAENKEYFDNFNNCEDAVASASEEPNDDGEIEKHESELAEKPTSEVKSKEDNEKESSRPQESETERKIEKDTERKQNNGTKQKTPNETERSHKKDTEKNSETETERKRETGTEDPRGHKIGTEGHDENGTDVKGENEKSTNTKNASRPLLSLLSFLQTDNPNENDASAEENNKASDGAATEGCEVAGRASDGGDISREESEHCPSVPAKVEVKPKPSGPEKPRLAVLRSPKFSENKQSPVEEMAQKAATVHQISASSRDADDVRGPFNFQALLRKTSIPRRDSLRRTNELKEPKVDLSLNPTETSKPSSGATILLNKEEKSEIKTPEDPETSDRPISSPKSSIGSTGHSGKSSPPFDQNEDDAKAGRLHESCREAVNRHRAVEKALTETDLNCPFEPSLVIKTAGARNTEAEIPHRKPKRLFESGRAQSMYVDPELDSDHLDVSRRRRCNSGDDGVAVSSDPELAATDPDEEGGTPDLPLPDEDQNSEPDDSDPYLPSDSEGSRDSDDDNGHLTNNRNNSDHKVITQITLLYDSTNQEGEYELIPGVFISGMSTDL